MDYRHFTRPGPALAPAQCRWYPAAAHLDRHGVQGKNTLANCGALPRVPPESPLETSGGIMPQDTRTIALEPFPRVPSARKAATRSLTAWTFAAVLMHSTGCGLFTSSEKSGEKNPFGSIEEFEGTVDPLEWQADLILFLNKSYSRWIGMASTIAERTQDKAVRESCLRWKVSVSDLTSHIMREQDLRRAGLFTWVALVQTRQQMEKGLQDGTGEFGTQQHYALATARALERDFLKLARKHFGEERISNVADDIEEVASKYPVTAHLSQGWEPLNAAAEEAAKQNDVYGILKAPLAPISGLQGVRDTPTAINRFTKVADSAVELLRRMPERTRWELELLLLELGELEPFEQLQADLDHFLKTFDAVSQTVGRLPEEVRMELEVTLKQVREAQPELKETLEQAESTARAMQEVGVEARQTALEINTTSEKLEALASAWDTTAKSVQKVLADYKALSDEPADEAGAADSKAPTVEDYTELARSFNQAATEIRALLADINEPFSDDAGIDQTVARAEAGAQAIVNALTWRGLLLLGMAFLLALVYHRITRRSTGAGEPAGSDRPSGSS